MTDDLISDNKFASFRHSLASVISMAKSNFADRNLELEMRMNVEMTDFYETFQSISSFTLTKQEATHNVLVIDDSDVRRLRSEYTAADVPIFIRSVAKSRLRPPIDIVYSCGKMRIDLQEEIVTDQIVSNGNHFRKRERCSFVFDDCPAWRVDYSRVIEDQRILQPSFEIEVELLPEALAVILSDEALRIVVDQAVVIWQRIGIN